MPLPPCLPSFVSLHDLHSGLLLAAAAAAALSPFICLPAWFHSGLLLAAPAALSPFICLPAWSPFWPALGCRCRLGPLHLSPAWSPFWPALGCPCRLKLSPFVCLPAWSQGGHMADKLRRRGQCISRPTIFFSKREPHSKLFGEKLSKSKAWEAHVHNHLLRTSPN